MAVSGLMSLPPGIVRWERGDLLVAANTKCSWADESASQ
ncbi:hypothetical protein PANN_48250 [Pseudomonas aeruginosa C-NN2]|nr:hypothetical protein PANN_48250 [Pseudomonas aeruginosa C-NN2]